MPVQKPNYRDWMVLKSHEGKFTAIQTKTLRTSPAFASERELQTWVDGQANDAARPAGKRK